MHIKSLQHHLLKRLFFLHWINFVHLSKFIWAYLCGSISLFFFLFSRSLYLFFCEYHSLDYCSYIMFWNLLDWFTPQIDYILCSRRWNDGMESHDLNFLNADLLSMAPPIRTTPSFPLSQSIPSGSFHKTLILINKRTDRRKTTITENQTDHKDHNLI